MLKLLSFVEEKPVHKIVSLAPSYMLFYYEEDDADSIRHCSFKREDAAFFNLDTGNKADIRSIIETHESFLVYNVINAVIFDSKNIESNEAVAIQYAIYDQILNGTNSLFIGDEGGPHVN